jgi:predicted nucleic acid-binding protein
MPARFVLDSSVTVDWLFNENDAAKRIEPVLNGAELVVPWLWRLEVINAVLVRERRKLLTIAQGMQLLEVLEEWDVEIIPEPAGRGLLNLSLVARPHQLSAYDAVYLDLAMSMGLALFTRDQNLKDAAKRVGVPLVAEAKS